ncbi:MAG: glycosyltransferase family 2 protein [Clostridium sp.]
MEEKILLSICCIAYNQEKYIGKAIESFLNQNVDFSIEILINDDASTDSTAQIIKYYENLYPNLIKGIYQKENQYSKGVSTAQIVREKAKGKYIAFCEGDDYWIDFGKLKKQVEFLEKNLEYIAVAHWCIVVDENDVETDAFMNSDQVFNFKKSDYTLKDYENESIPGHINTIVHRNIFNNKKYNKIYEECTLVGDRTTYLILVLLGKIKVFHSKMSAYRYITNNGISYSSRVKEKNQNYDWYEYYTNLEKAIKKEMGREIDLKKFKYHHLFNAIRRYRNSKSEIDKKIYLDIWNEVSKIGFIKYCIEKSIGKIVLNNK